MGVGQFSREVRQALRAAGRRGAVRPQSGVEAVFQASQGVEVGPDGAVEDGGDGGVVDAGQGLGLAEACAVEGGAQVQGDDAGGLHFRHVAGDVRPAAHAFSGRGPLGSGHNLSVGRRPRLTVVADGGEDGLFISDETGHTGDNNQQQVEGDPVAAAIANYTPNIPPEDWDAISHFVRAAVTHCTGQVSYSAQDLFKAATRHVW